jgi:hypothetical protein
MTSACRVPLDAFETKLGCHRFPLRCLPCLSGFIAFEVILGFLWMPSNVALTFFDAPLLILQHPLVIFGVYWVPLAKAQAREAQC